MVFLNCLMYQLLFCVETGQIKLFEAFRTQVDEVHFALSNHIDLKYLLDCNFSIYLFPPPPSLLHKVVMESLIKILMLLMLKIITIEGKKRKQFDSKFKIVDLINFSFEGFISQHECCYFCLNFVFHYLHIC